MFNFFKKKIFFTHQHTICMACGQEVEDEHDEVGDLISQYVVKEDDEESIVPRGLPC